MKKDKIWFFALISLIVVIWLTGVFSPMLNGLLIQ
jgi:hypothetical protein